MNVASVSYAVLCVSTAQDSIIFLLSAHACGLSPIKVKMHNKSFFKIQSQLQTEQMFYRLC